MPSRLRELLRHLLVGLAAVVGLLVGVGIATAQEGEPTPPPPAATPVPQPATAAAPAPAPTQTCSAPEQPVVDATAAAAPTTTTASEESDDDDDGDGPIDRLRRARDAAFAITAPEAGTSSGGGPATTSGSDGTSSPQAGDAGADANVAANPDPHEATTVLTGDLRLKIGQEAEAETGDAIASGQVTGVTADGNVTIGADNGGGGAGGGGGSDASTGDATATNTTTIEGPLVGGDVAVNDSTVNGSVGTSTIVEGDVKIKIKLEAEALTGDALASGQLFGVNAGGNVTIEGLNGGGGTGGGGSSTASSGTATALNELTIFGPLVGGNVILTNSTVNGPVTSSVVVFGDITIKIKFKSTSATGDAIADGQVFGVVAGGAVDIDATNAGGGRAQSTSGNAGSGNTADLGAPVSGGVEAAPVEIDGLPAQAKGPARDGAKNAAVVVLGVLLVLSVAGRRRRAVAGPAITGFGSAPRVRGGGRGRRSARSPGS